MYTLKLFIFLTLLLNLENSYALILFKRVKPIQVQQTSMVPILLLLVIIIFIVASLVSLKPNASQNSKAQGKTKGVLHKHGTVSCTDLH